MRMANAVMVTAVVLLASAWPVAAQRGVIRSTGEAIASFMPDTGSLYCTIRVEHRDVAVAKQQLAQKVAAVVKDLHALAIPGMQVSTENFDLSPVLASGERATSLPLGGPAGPPMADDDADTGRNITGYRVRSSIRVIVTGSPTDLAAGLSRAMETLGKTGAYISGPYFSCRDYKAAQHEALEKATRDAVENVTAIAKGLGRTINEFSYAGEFPQTDHFDYAPGTWGEGEIRGPEGPPASPTPIEVAPLSKLYRIYISATY